MKYILGSHEFWDGCKVFCFLKRLYEQQTCFLWAAVLAKCFLCAGSVHVLQGKSWACNTLLFYIFAFAKEKEAKCTCVFWGYKSVFVYLKLQPSLCS